MVFLVFLGGQEQENACGLAAPTQEVADEQLSRKRLNDVNESWEGEAPAEP